MHRWRPHQPREELHELMIKVLIAEDQRMLSSALAALLELEKDITVVAQAAGCPGIPFYSAGPKVV